jgi:uncharacterized protein
MSNKPIRISNAITIWRTRVKSALRIATQRLTTSALRAPQPAMELASVAGAILHAPEPYENYPMRNAPPLPSVAGDSLRQFHADVEHIAGKLHLVHIARTQCQRGCSSCCSDDLNVFSIESDAIKLAYGSLLMLGVPHAIGACAFLAEDGACRIYAHRPYVCRTQGLPLRWLEALEPVLANADPTEVQFTRELRDICPLNEPGIPIEELAAEDCWTLGPSEERLTELQLAHSAGAAPRIALRSLFCQPPASRYDAT